MRAALAEHKAAEALAWIKVLGIDTLRGVGGAEGYADNVYTRLTYVDAPRASRGLTKLLRAVRRAGVTCQPDPTSQIMGEFVVKRARALIATYVVEREIYLYRPWPSITPDFAYHEALHAALYYEGVTDWQGHKYIQYIEDVLDFEVGQTLGRIEAEFSKEAKCDPDQAKRLWNMFEQRVSDWQRDIGMQRELVVRRVTGFRVTVNDVRATYGSGLCGRCCGSTPVSQIVRYRPDGHQIAPIGPIAPPPRTSESPFFSPGTDPLTPHGWPTPYQR